MWKRFFQIHFIPLIISLAVFYFIFQLSGKVKTEWQTWDEINRNPIETEAAIISKLAAISSSGSISKYDITYEFVAPAAKGGSNYSRAALGDRLREIYENPGKKPEEIKMPEERHDGNQYFSRTQVVDPSEVKNQYGNNIKIVYAKDNPQNSMIKGTGGYPLFWIVFLLGMAIFGGYLFYSSVLQAFRLKS
jgi:hypothetical protein